MFLREEWSDAKIVSVFRNGTEAECNKALYFLLHKSGWEGRTINYVINNQGNEEDGKDVFQESILELLKTHRLREGVGFRGDNNATLHTYFHRIVIRKWNEMQRTKNKEIEAIKSINSEGGEIIDYSNLLVDGEKKMFLKAISSKISERCQQIFLLRAEKKKMKEISELLGISNEEAVRSALKRCNEILDKLVAGNPHWKKFLED